MSLARDIMSKPVISVTPTTPITEAARVLLDNQISGCPVMDINGRLRGILSRGNLLDYALRVEGGALTPILRLLVPGGAERTVEEVYAPLKEENYEVPGVQEIMTAEVITVVPEAPLPEVAQKLSSEHIHRVPVMDQDRVVGIITSLDLLREFATMCQDN